MIYYKPQSENPEKHALMPSEYPWSVSPVSLEGFIEIEDSAFTNLINSIDISEYNKFIQEENNLKQQTDQREFGIGVIPYLIDAMGERNLTLSQNGTALNMLTIASDNSGIKLLIETGALKTARSISGMLKMKYPTHSDIYTKVMVLITNFLIERGYE